MKLYLFATLQMTAGRGEIDVPLGESRELMHVLAEVAGPLGEQFQTTLFDGEGTIARDVVVHVNDRIIGRGERVVVRDADEVTLLMPLGGG